MKILAVTDLHAYLFNAKALRMPTPTALAEKVDLADVAAEYRRSFLLNRLTYRSTRRQAARTLWIAALDHDDAEKVVEAINSGP